MSKLMETFTMNPRLKSSKSWTKFPKEYSDQILAVFNENFAEFLKDATLIIDGRIYSEEIVLRVGYLEKGRLLQANFEASMNYSQTEQDALQRIHNCVDAAASMMMEYLENKGEVDFPYKWKEYNFQGNKLYLQFSTENSSLEEEANRLLGLTEEDLFNEDISDDEDALTRAELDEELSPPRDDETYHEEKEDEDLASPSSKKSKLH